MEVRACAASRPTYCDAHKSQHQLQSALIWQVAGGPGDTAPKVMERTTDKVPDSMTLRTAERSMSNLFSVNGRTVMAARDGAQGFDSGVAGR